MKKFLLFLLGIISVLVTFVAYLFRPTSLGVSYTSANLASLYKKINVSFESLPLGTPVNKSLIFFGSHPVTLGVSLQDIAEGAKNSTFQMRVCRCILKFSDQLPIT